MTKASIESADGQVSDKFCLRTAAGGKITDSAQQQAVITALQSLLSSKTLSVTARPKFGAKKAGDAAAGTIMGACPSLGFTTGSF